MGQGQSLSWRQIRTGPVWQQTFPVRKRPGKKVGGNHRPRAETGLTQADTTQTYTHMPFPCCSDVAGLLCMSQKKPKKGAGHLNIVCRRYDNNFETTYIHKNKLIIHTGIIAMVREHCLFFPRRFVTELSSYKIYHCHFQRKPIHQAALTSTFG